MKIVWLMLGALAIAACCASLARGSGKEMQPVPVFDAHCDTALDMLDSALDIGVLNRKGHIDIPRMKKGGVAVQVFALWLSRSYIPGQAAHRVLSLLDCVLGAIQKNSDSMELALTAEEAEKIHARGKIAAFISIEGGEAIENDLGLLRDFYRLGVRSMTLTWMNNTDWADASGDAPCHGGLTDFGISVIKEMNRLGMIIDLSHSARSTYKKVMEVTTKPVLVSHSCCYALCDHFRNVTDDELRALAANGGVIGINFACDYLDQNYKNSVEKIRAGLKPRIAALEKEHGQDRNRLQSEKRALYRDAMKDVPPVTIDRVIEHIDHAVSVAGIEHVGLVSDFDGISKAPEGIDDCSMFQEVARKLKEKGYSKKEIEMIMGENLRRLFREVIGK